MRFSGRFFGFFLSFVAVCQFIGLVNAADSTRVFVEATYDRPVVEVGGAIADDGGAGEINIIAPILFSEGRDLVFFGADAKFSGLDINHTDDTVYNVGGYIGYRRLLDDNGGVFGLWAGLDHFNTEQSNDFTRAIVGVEYFGSQVIARANAFVPLDSSSDEWSVTSGGFITTYDEKVPSGFDAELGLRMVVPMDRFVRPGELRVFAGGYDFIGLDDDGGDVFGGRGRVEFDLYPFEESPHTRLSFEASFAYDKHSGEQYSAGVKLSIPLGVTNKITTHGAKDETVAELDSFGQDLFQPIRRNRASVSRIRQKGRALVGGGGSGVAGFSLSSVCGGPSGSLTLNSGLASTTIKRGAFLGVIDPAGAATPLSLTLADMVAPDGKTLREMLASAPKTINTTLKFARTMVDFTTQSVRPSAAVALRSRSLNSQTIKDAVVTIEGNTCSLNLEVAALVPPLPGPTLTLDTICGGKATNISLIGVNGALNSATVKQGDELAIINPAGSASPLLLDLANMVAPDGRTMSAILAGNPATLNSTFKFSATTVDFTNQTVRPHANVALTSGATAEQTVMDAILSVNNSSCQLSLTVAQTPIAVPLPPPTPPASGLTLATLCGGPNAQIPISPFNPAGPLVTSSVQQGDLIGTIEPSGSVLTLNLANMVSLSGTSVTDLLASQPDSLDETLVFAGVDFATVVARPAFNVSQASVSASLQRIRRFSLTIAGNSCSAIIHNA